MKLEFRNFFFWIIQLLKNDSYVINLDDYKYIILFGNKFHKKKINDFFIFRRYGTLDEAQHEGCWTS